MQKQRGQHALGVLGSYHAAFATTARHIEHLPDHLIREELTGRITGYSGAFREMVEAYESIGVNLRELIPEAFLENDATIDALNAVEDGTDPRAAQLCTVIEQYFGVLSMLETVTKGKGRESGMDDLTYYLGKWGDELVNDGMSYEDAAEHILKELRTIAESDRKWWQRQAYTELNDRNRYDKTYRENPFTGENDGLSPRQKYLKGVVNRYRTGNSKLVVRESSGNTKNRQ